MMPNLSEFEKAKQGGFIGIEGDIYEQQLSRFHAVLIEYVEGVWIAYRVSWREDGQIKKMADLLESDSFDEVLETALEYIKRFRSWRK